MPEKESPTRGSWLRKTIIASVIATLIVIIIIQPLLRLIWSGVSALGLRVFQEYVDSIYRNAALGHRNDGVVTILLLILGTALGLMFGINTMLTIRFLRPETKPKKLNRGNRLIILWVLAFLFTVSASSVIVRPFTDLKLNTSFQQRLKIIAPKITELEMKELEAAWASMLSRSDYESLMSRLELMAQDRGITFPPPLLK